MKPLRWCVALVALLLVACGGGDDKGGILGVNQTSGRESSPTPSASTPARGTTPAASTPARSTPAPRVEREDWQIAMLDDSKSLPGEYVKPHPGTDGVVCDTKACVGRFDDRNHTNGAIPICTQAQLSAGTFTGPLCYNSNPPTSGPHSPNFVTPRVYTDPVEKERLVHTMEHAAVIIWYNTTDQNAIRTLAQITNGANQSGKLVVMSPYPGMEANTIALTAWTRLDKFTVSQLRDQRVLDFINAHSKRYNPEGF